MLENLQDSPILQTIAEFVRDVTEEDLERASEILDAPGEGEKHLGYLDSQLGRKLWCAGRRIVQQIAILASQGVMAGKEESAALKKECERLTKISELSRTLFWMECNEVIGAWGQSVGIRSGWIIVDPKEDGDDTRSALLRKIFGSLE